LLIGWLNYARREDAPPNANGRMETGGDYSEAGQTRGAGQLHEVLASCYLRIQKAGPEQARLCVSLGPFTLRPAP